MNRYYDVQVRAPGGDPLTYLLYAPSDLDAKARAQREHSDAARIPVDDVEVLSVTEVTPG